MAFQDLREFTAFLEKKGQLQRIKTPVKCELEITEITDRVSKAGGPALLFENVTGYDIPVLINTFGGHTLHAVETSAGTVNLMFWGAAQTGRWGLETQRAGAIDAEAGFQPKILPILKPWVRGGYTWGSGNDNPEGNTHGTFFQLLPTPRPYARFPFYNMMNNEDAFGALILRPHTKVTVTSEYHSLRLTDGNDFWYSGGGVFQPWTFGYSGRSTSGRRSPSGDREAPTRWPAGRSCAWPTGASTCASSCGTW